MPVFHRLVNGLPVFRLGEVAFISPEFVLVADDPVLLTMKLLRYLHRLQSYTNYTPHIFYRGETIDSYTIRNNRCFGKYALMAQAEEYGYLLVQTPSGLVKVQANTGEGKVIDERD